MAEGGKEVSGAPPSLRDAWAQVVKVDDYEAFMASIGQAQANARLVSAMLPSDPARVLFAGAGAGQMLRYMDASVLAKHQLVFTDINTDFLSVLDERLRAAGLSNFTVALDDLERSALTDAFDVAIVVLVLEHIDWRRGVESLARIGPRRCCVVIQENPASMISAVTPGRTPQGTMRVFVESRPKLVPIGELKAAMTEHGYELESESAEEVLDGKRMVGLTWVRASENHRVISQISDTGEIEGRLRP